MGDLSQPSGITREETEPPVPTPLATPGGQKPARARERGEAIGRYVVVDTLGRGGMGVVYVAWDPELDRRVALKLVSFDPQRGTDSEGHPGRLLREAKALARLEHPNVVKIHDVGMTDGQLFIAMEKVEGQNLREWLRAHRRSLGAVLDVFLAAGRGLAAAHAEGLVHRDFKPDNVLVGEDGTVKVVDFGLARDTRGDDRPRAREWVETEPAVARALDRAGRRRELEADAVPVQGRDRRDSEALEAPPDSQRSSPLSALGASSSHITGAGTVLGTPAYMAPEQHARATVDERSDLYAFCLSLWEAVYGKRPFSGQRGPELAARKRRLEIRESGQGRRVPKWLRATMLRGLAVDPDHRFADMETLLAEIEGHLERRRRRVVPLIMSAAIVLLLSAATFSVFVQHDRSTCAAPVERLEGVWDAPRRAAVERALLASDLAYAADTWTRVNRGLDEYATRWLEAEVEACEVKQDPASLERRLACLELRRRSLASLTELLARSDAKMVEHAARAVGSLPSIQSCEGEQGQADLTPLPEDAHTRLRVERQLDQLAAARAELQAAHLEVGLERAREVLDTARELGWRPLEAEALLVIGSHEPIAGGDRSGGLDTLHAAARAALEGAHPRLAVLAWNRLARALVSVRELDEAARWITYADHLAQELELGEEGASFDARIVAELAYSRAQLHFHRNDFAEAEVHARRRLELVREWYGEGSPQLADALNNLGVTVYMQWRKDEAIEAYSQALAILEEVQGPDHPSVATMHNNIGVVATDRKQFAQARAHYARAVEIRVRVYGSGHPLSLQSEINLANLYLFSGDPASGVGLALEIVAQVEAQIAEALAQARAREASDEELARVEVAALPDLLRLARLLAGAGQHRQAAVIFEHALALLDAVPGVRLPPGFEPPAKGEPWPIHLDGCRADLLTGIEASAAALGWDSRAQQAAAERAVIPVKQPAYPRRCLDELGRWQLADHE